MIDEAALRRHFPVHALVAADLTLRQLGPTLERLSGPAAGRPFEALFSIERPALGAPSLEALRDLGPSLCLVRFLPNGMSLRCEFVASSDGGVVLLGSPSVGAAAELSTYGLALGDFPAHDPTSDFLMVLGTHRATLDDLRQLTEKQRKHRLKLEETNTRLNAAHEEARRASEVKSRFLAHMSHELRTPLHAISGLSKLLLETPDDAQRQEYLTAIHGSSQVLVSLVGQVLDLAKIESGHMALEQAPLSVVGTLSSVLQPLQARAALKGLGFTSHLDVPEETWVQGDALRVQQIALNLVGNAIKFTERGHVDVRVSFFGERLRLEVRDTGPGLSAENIERLFKPFVQVAGKSVHGGTGLGLSISRELAALMNGTVIVRSQVGEGCVFTFEAPFSSVSLVEAPPVLPASEGLEILLVDDNAINRLLGQRLLEREGHRVVIASSGTEALALLAARSVDVVLMDVQMPELDGLETTRLLRQRGDGTPIVALTANAVVGDRETCLAAGMTDYLAKPLEIPRLRAALARAAPSARSSA